MSARHGDKRVRRREAAIAALLTSPSVVEAARVAGVSESTLTRMLRDPDFLADYRAARRGIVDTAVGGLQRATGEAVEALRRNLATGNPSTEVASAKAILDMALRGVELMDINARLEMLEARANQERPPHEHREPSAAA